MIESSLDAKDYIDEIYNDKINNYVYSLGMYTSGLLDDLLKNVDTALSNSKSVIDNMLSSLNKNILYSRVWLNELADNLQHSLQNYANGLAYLLNGGVLPPGACGPDTGGAENTFSPIILDLDGDGVETRSLQDEIYFDHDGNQFAENTGWVGADDGLLVLDKTVTASSKPETSYSAIRFCR